MKKVYLTICLHNHQPVGNFDHVFEHNYNVSYKPFIDLYERFPGLKIGLHCSGPLWDWIEDKHPEYIDRVKVIADSGTLEILAGAYYEPILSMLTETDRSGQIKKMRDYIQKRFGQNASGFWLAERIWEQEITSSLADSGIKYTIVDDSHFKNAGLAHEQLNGYYMTEDHGKMIALFGTNENLRYLIPFKEPHEIRDYLWSIKEENPGSLLVYGDDGEKFGGWPGTYDWVYKDGWLERFLTMLQDNREWLELITPEEALQKLKPLGKIYIPDSSYREMMEWALPLESGRTMNHVVEELKQQPIWNEVGDFIRGGNWRNFKYKYPEANQMYARSLELSNKLQAADNTVPEDAWDYLYKAQCNCPYWHGVFGGLYLNHLRFETYRNFIRAEALLNSNIRNNKEFIATETDDFNLDGHKEIVLMNKWHRLYFQPGRGGRIYEWDFFPAKTNLLDTLSRREEVYHREILETPDEQHQDDVQSIHDMWKLKDPTVRDYLTYDPYERKSFLEHFISGEITPEKLRKNEIWEHGPLPLNEYSPELDEKSDSITLSQIHKGEFQINDIEHKIDIIKTLEMSKNSSIVKCTYKIINNGEHEFREQFGLEWNFALLAGKADDRYYFIGDEKKSGMLNAELQRKGVRVFGLVDEWQKIRITFDFNNNIDLFTFPIETVSQSESAYERVYQSSVVFPVIYLDLNPREENIIDFSVNVTSI
ncbi:alpha-amylase/4-alpha-glucanotransferase domain-containing protein [candidate division KSB1 bacterium]